MKKLNNSNAPEFKKGLTEAEINSPEFDPDEFAPAPEVASQNSENESIENKRNALVFAFVVALFALIIGLVGWGVSASVIAYSEKAEEREVLSVFSNCDRIEEYKANKDGYKVYAVFFKEKMAGFCVSGTTEGFGGKIDYLVAFNSENKISKIKIVDHNESRGLGSKIEGEGFLSQFYGLLVGNVSENYDLISGATTSSKAVGESIRSVLGLGLSSDSIAKELGYETITEEEIEEEIKKEEDNKKDPSKDTSSDTTGSTKPGVGDFQGGSNANSGDGDIDIDGVDDTTVYDTETTESDEDTTVPEDTTGAPEDTTAKPEETTGTPEDTTAPVEDTTAPEDTTAEDTTANDTTSETTADTTAASADDTTATPAAAVDEEEN